MFLHHFTKKENKHKKLAKNIYSSLIKIVEFIMSSDEFKIKKNFNSTFELMTIFIFAIFFANKKDIKKLLINQHLMDLYIEDIDKTMRELGIGDMRIGKFVKSYVKKFYYRISRLEEIFVDSNYNKFEKYINKRDLNDKKVNLEKFNQFLFLSINKLINISKKEDLSKLSINILFN